MYGTKAKSASRPATSGYSPAPIPALNMIMFAPSSGERYVHSTTSQFRPRCRSQSESDRLVINGTFIEHTRHPSFNRKSGEIFLSFSFRAPPSGRFSDLVTRSTPMCFQLLPADYSILARHITPANSHGRPFQSSALPRIAPEAHLRGPRYEGLKSPGSS